MQTSRNCKKSNWKTGSAVQRLFKQHLHSSIAETDCDLVFHQDIHSKTCVQIVSFFSSSLSVEFCLNFFWLILWNLFQIILFSLYLSSNVLKRIVHCSKQEQSMTFRTVRKKMSPKPNNTKGGAALCQRSLCSEQRWFGGRVRCKPPFCYSLVCDLWLTQVVFCICFVLVQILL